MNRRVKCQLLSLMLLLPTGIASAQLKIEVFRGGEAGGASEKNVIPGKITTSSLTNDPVSPPAAESAPAATQPDSESPPYSDESVQRIRQSSSSLAASSMDSFRRGLMPLHDHLDQLRIVADSEFRLVGGTEGGRIQVAARHLGRMRQVERALSDFDQPNAEGWRADLYLARAMVAQAEFDLATAEGNPDAAEFAALRARILAERHVIERRFDSSLGLASLPMLLQAEMLTPDGAARGRELLVEVVRQTRRWNELGAGIGRADRLFEAEFELARFDFFVAFDSEAQDIEASFRAASEASQRLLEQKIGFYQSGTASLYEIARSWQNMREIVEYAASTKNGVSQATIEQSRNDLNRVVELATAKNDRRGRIGADVGYVSLIHEIATAK